VRDAARRLRLDPPAATIECVALGEERTLRDATALHPDALPALEGLARVVPLALVSNASPAAGALLDSLGLQPFFAATAWSFRVGVLKPDPAIYRSACAALRVPPERCLFVGDGNARELDGARTLGMFAVRIARVMSLSSDRSEASRAWDAAIDDLREVAGLLGPPSR
jgi:putative hydrolase of the HAD superfamily